jgi:hypothetical protein
MHRSAGEQMNDIFPSIHEFKNLRMCAKQNDLFDRLEVQGERLSAMFPVLSAGTC